MKTHIWNVLESLDKKNRAARLYGAFMSALIVSNAAAAVLGTNATLESRYGTPLRWFEYGSVFIFSLEYLARAWFCTLDPRYEGRFGRLRYLLSPLAVVDLLSIAPFFLTFTSVDLRTLRLARLVRIGRLVRIKKYHAALDTIRTVVLGQWEELVLCVLLLFMLTLVSGSAIYYCENTAQPEKFPDVPASLSWAVGTLTGSAAADAQPVTAAGKLCGLAISILGILMFALPAGILSAGFMAYSKNLRNHAVHRCPHCGKAVMHGDE